MVLTGSFVEVEGGGVGVEGCPKAGGGEAEVDGTPAEVHLVKSPLRSRGLGHANGAAGYVGHAPGAEDVHADARTVEALLVEVGEVQRLRHERRGLQEEEESEDGEVFHTELNKAGGIRLRHSGKCGVFR